VDAVGHVIGMISNRDVLAQFHRTQKDRIPLDRIMSGDVLTVRPDTLAREAVALLIEKKVDALPVVDEDGKLVGILTATDFLELAFRALHGVPYTPPRAET
jgi:CBS domain-containing protein